MQAPRQQPAPAPAPQQQSKLPSGQTCKYQGHWNEDAPYGKRVNIGNAYYLCVNGNRQYISFGSDSGRRDRCAADGGPVNCGGHNPQRAIVNCNEFAKGGWSMDYRFGKKINKDGRLYVCRNNKLKDFGGHASAGARDNCAERNIGCGF